MPIDKSNIDKSDMIRQIEEFPAQCKTALGLTQGMSVSGKISNIVVVGMGGSGIAGDILKVYMENSNSKLPVYVSKDYRLPEFVSKGSLVFINSYSGNTEEIISSYNDAVKKNANIVGITSGGELGRVCKRVINLPSGFQPRAALGFLFFPILGVLSNAGIIRVPNGELKETFNILKDAGAFRSEGRDIAKQIENRTPLIYASNKFGAAAYRWKCQLNENGKIQAFANVFSELNHNEIVAYTTTKKDRFIPIFLRDSTDHPRIIKRMDITKKIIGQKVDVIDVESKGESYLARLFSLMYVSDFVSYFVAVNNNTDPTPVAVIENLKKEMKK